MTYELSVKTARWDITAECNLACLHCYTPAKRIRDLGTADVLKILQILLDNGLHELNLSGREPTMRKDLPQIIEWCRSYDITVNMTTNGTLLNESQFPAVASRLNILTFSLDGPSATIHNKIRGQGNFNITLQNLKKCANTVRRGNSKMQLGVSCTLSRYNHLRIDKMIDICESLGLDFLAINPVTLCGSARFATASLYLNAQETAKAWDLVCRAYSATKQTCKLHLGVFPMEAKLINLQHKLNLPVIQNGCTAGKTLYITPDGQAYPCYMILPMAETMSELKEYLTPWNVLAEPLSNAAKHFAPFLKFVHTCTQRNKLTCVDCSDNEICRPCPLLVKFDPEAIRRCELACEAFASLKVTIKDSSIPIRKENITWHIRSNRVIVQLVQADYTSQRIYELNPIARCIWQVIDGEHTIVSIKKALTKEFSNFSLQYIHEQTVQLLTYLWKESIIEFTKNVC